MVTGGKWSVRVSLDGVKTSSFKKLGHYFWRSFVLLRMAPELTAEVVSL